MARLWMTCVTLLTLATMLPSLSVLEALPGLSTEASAQTCLGQGVSVSPSTVTPPGQITITADGFMPGSQVQINVSPPPGWSFTAQSQPIANAQCRAVSVIQIGSCPGCPSGTATVTASGIRPNESTASYQTTFFISNSQAGPSPTPTFQPAPLSCTVPTASTSPTVITQGQSTTFVASGFAPQTSVTIQLSGPGPGATIPATANSLCQVATTVTFQLTDPPGVWTFTASGTAYAPAATNPPPPSFNPLLLTGPSAAPLTLSANVQVLPAATATVPGATSTPVSFCPNPSVTISGTPVVSGQQALFSGVGFRPGAMVQVRLEDPATGSAVPFFADSQVGPATGTCSVSGFFVANPTVPPGRYRLVLTGPNHLGANVTARSDFDVVSAQGVVTPTPMAPPPVGEPTFTPTPPIGPVATAPVAIEQQIAIVGGAQVPQVGVSSTYEHVIRVTNTSPTALDGGALGALLELLAASLQGQGVTMSFTTDYAEGSTITAASANVGSTTVRGASVSWNGQLQSGQSLELRTTFDNTPTTALVLNQPIRGQTFSVSDPRGVTLALAAPPPPPRLPPAQRLVQPPPPPVDPITGPRFFATTGFGIGDDAVWTYYVRRGGFRTFGAPISRLFTLTGAQVQLFEKGMLARDEGGNVVSVNLLEPPFLAYDTFGDLRLPPVDEGILAAFPDPSLPGFPDRVQDFVMTHAAETFDQKPARFYTTYLGTVLYSDAFFLGPGDPNLLPGFNLEIWGVPVSQAGYRVLGYEFLPGAGPSGEDIWRPILDQNVVLQRFQRGLMRYDHTTGTTSAVATGPYLRAVLTGQVTDAEFAEAASASPLWAQYNPDGDPATWLDRPDELPDTNLQLAFEPQTEQ